MQLVLHRHWKTGPKGRVSCAMLQRTFRTHSSQGNHTRFADPPLVFSTDCARTAPPGSGWLGTERVWVWKSVPAATTRNGRWFGEGKYETASVPSRRILAIARVFLRNWMVVIEKGKTSASHGQSPEANRV